MNNLFALVENNSNRALCIFDSGMLSFYKEKLPSFKIIEVESVGSSTINLKENGNCSTISISPKGSNLMKDDYHIVKNWSDSNLSLGEVYKLIS